MDYLWYPANLLPERLACLIDCTLAWSLLCSPPKRPLVLLHCLYSTNPLYGQQDLSKVRVLLSNLTIDMASFSGFEEETLRYRLVFEYRVKYSRVSIYSSPLHIWFSIRRVSKYRYRNTEYLNTPKSSNTLDPPLKEDLNT
jgi:hypothetical protein